ncbi:hypothetical protein [Streptomyces sp. NPDC059165]|uniref:hypothetical protein n=1 Tax=Streptomyces sp. NPDC059165 TaxID=3346751 RepID=UPI0036B55173
MQVMRRSLIVVSVAAVVVLATGAGAGAGTAVRAEAAPAAEAVEVAEADVAVEADVAHHGYAWLWDGRIGVWAESSNDGPGQVADATVRLAFSVPLSSRLQLPPSCLRGGDRVVLCRTGALPVGGRPKGISLDLRALGKPDELVMAVSTAWSDGAVDRNRANDEHRVLVLATADGYVF